MPDTLPSVFSNSTPKNTPNWLDTLNKAQRTAVEAPDGPTLVLAGAGTGKTRVLTSRIAWLLANSKVWPSQIFAVTFTNRAAREMKKRISQLGGEAVEGMPWLGTFHAMGARILRRHAELAGLQSNFTILDTDDQLRLLKQLVRASNIDEKRWPARQLAAHIDGWKNRGLTPDTIPTEDAHLYADGQSIDLYKAYQQRLKTINAADFGDLILEVLEILKNYPNILTSYQKHFRYILVDEYQDTNTAQYLWLRLLARKHHNICCVGDDDQSIYGWRGAQVGNILRFEKDFPDAQIIRLELNYRSTPHILGAASGLIAGNKARLGKTLWTEQGAGEKVSVRSVMDGGQEARLIADYVEAMQRDQHDLNEMAILMRAGFQTREFEDCFLERGIPYRVIGGPRFYERAEIRDANAYFRLIHQPADDLAFERIINLPRRGLGSTTLQTIHKLAQAQNCSLMGASEKLAATEDLTPQARYSLTDFLNMMTQWRHVTKTIPLTEFARQVLDEAGYTTMWQNAKTADAPGRLDNIKELVHSLEPFETLEAYLEHIALVMEAEQSDVASRISLMTIHNAKGLEFDAVFLPGWEEELFPHPRTLNESGLEGLEEERRLAYVALTRARKRAFISFAANRQVYNRWVHTVPSRFIDELPPEHIETDIIIADIPPTPSTIKRYHTQSAASKNSAISVTKSKGDFVSGERIFHQKFGYGHITSIEDDRFTIEFDKAGSKKIMVDFVEKVTT
ncbi:MAG: UvrD-helicase domain-containing protein [Parvularculales bacterium]